MTLIRWNSSNGIAGWQPVGNLAREIYEMQREIEKAFDRSWSASIRDCRSGDSFIPLVDTIERENDYLVKIELPGVDRSEVKILVQNEQLIVRGEKKKEQEKGSGGYHQVERVYGKFERLFALPSFVKGDQIKANYANGVLHITIPKAEEAKPKELEIEIK